MKRQEFYIANCSFGVFRVPILMTVMENVLKLLVGLSIKHTTVFFIPWVCLLRASSVSFVYGNPVMYELIICKIFITRRLDIGERRISFSVVIHWLPDIENNISLKKFQYNKEELKIA